MEAVDKEAEALAALEKAEAAAAPLQTSLSMLRRGEGLDDNTPIMVGKSLMYKAAPYKFVDPLPNRRRARKVPPPSTEGVAAQTTAMMLGTKTYAAELSKARSEGRFLL